MGNKSIRFGATRARAAPFVYIIGIQQPLLIYDARHLFLLSSSATEERSDENLIKKSNAWKDLAVNLLLRPGRLIPLKTARPVSLITDGTDWSP